MIIRDSNQFKETPNLPGMNKTPFDYIKQQNEIRNMTIRKEQTKKEVDTIKELKQLDNNNFREKFTNPLSNPIYKGK